MMNGRGKKKKQRSVWFWFYFWDFTLILGGVFCEILDHFIVSLKRLTTHRHLKCDRGPSYTQLLCKGSQAWKKTGNHSFNL